MEKVTNPFSAYAANTKPAWQKRKEATAQKRKLNHHQQKAMNKALADRDLLFRLYKKWCATQIDESLAGPFKNIIERLIDFLRGLTLDSEHTLVDFIDRVTWPEEIRHLALRLIDARLVQLREERDLPPFNDALFDEPLTVFQVVRDKLKGARK